LHNTNPFDPSELVLATVTSAPSSGDVAAASRGKHAPFAAIQVSSGQAARAKNPDIPQQPEFVEEKQVLERRGGKEATAAPAGVSKSTSGLIPPSERVGRERRTAAAETVGDRAEICAAGAVHEGAEQISEPDVPSGAGAPQTRPSESPSLDLTPSSGDGGDGNGPAAGVEAAIVFEEDVPSGSGKVEVRLTAVDMAVPDVCPQVITSVRGKGLHAPLVERLLELPMDIYGGRLDGEIRIHMERPEHWEGFPGFSGCIQVSGSSFHFWDSPDDFTGTDMTLVFEEDRMRVLDGRGAYGAVAVTARGEMGLNPENGEYNLQVRLRSSLQ
jgi:hypothetical protein